VILWGNEYTYWALMGNLKKRDYLEDLGVDKKVIF
jgi:hypothetical protein